MKKLLLMLAVIGCGYCNEANSQEKGTAKERPANTSAPDWQQSYQQESAREYIRRRAQDKTAARQARIEGMKWLGHSPARPVVSTTPFMGRAPSWAGVSYTGYWGPGLYPVRAPGYSPSWLP
jgi:hypothetical protein